MLSLGNSIKRSPNLSNNGLRNSSAHDGDRVSTPEQNTQLWKRAGEIINGKLSNLIINQAYQNLADDEKAKKIEDFINKSKLSARVEMIMQLTEGLQGEELKTKLSEVKKSGLMTREVYNKFIELR